MWNTLSMSEALIYEGSVKNLWQVGLDRLEFEYTDAYSVFDWGRMPDALPGKGEALAALGEHFFTHLEARESWRGLCGRPRLARALGYYQRLGFAEALAEELVALQRDGLCHHFLSRTARNRLAVRRVHVERPRLVELAGREIYDYASIQVERPHLLPLEVVFRCGVPRGSSFLERLDARYARELSLPSSTMKEGERFEGVIIEMFSKLERGDRYLSFEQALNYARLAPEVLRRLVARTVLIACWLGEHLAERGLELWDGKLEWAISEAGELMLVDSIGPDELRLCDAQTGAELSKELLRGFYRRTPWYQALLAEKQAGGAWKRRMQAERKLPPPLSPAFREMAERLYPSLAAWVTGKPSGGAAVDLPAMRQLIARCRE